MERILTVPLEYRRQTGRIYTALWHKELIPLSAPPADSIIEMFHTIGQDKIGFKRSTISLFKCGVCRPKLHFEVVLLPNGQAHRMGGKMAFTNRYLIGPKDLSRGAFWSLHRNLCHCCGCPNQLTSGGLFLHRGPNDPIPSQVLAHAIFK